MNRNIMKYIAIVAMTLDHIAAFLVTSNPTIYLIFRIIGRITFPIMCLFISEGFRHTSNKKKYALRLLLVAVISQIPWTLLQYNTLFTLKILTNLNTIFTLFLGYLYLLVLNSNHKLLYKILLLIPLTLGFFICDYTIIGLLYILFFFYINKNLRIALLPLLYFISILINVSIGIFTNSNILTSIIINSGLFLTIPLFYTYNNKSGSKNLFHKYFFYIYYPLHLLLIFFIK